MEENNSVAPDTRSNDELDALVDNSNTARNTERPMSSEKTSEPTKSDPKKAQEDYEFIHNGKPVRGTRDQILKWAQQGYDYPQRAQKLNQDRAKWEQERQQFEQQRQKYAPYTQIDEWAAKNPTQWQQLQDLWKKQQDPAFNQQQSTQVAPEFQPYISKIQSLEQQLSQIIPSVQQFNDWRTQTTQKEEDSKLEQEIQSIRDQYKDLDWVNVDENGKSLETRVLEHAQANGISKFGPAFRDLLHDDLMSRAQAQAKQSVAKAVQTRTKLGVLGESPTSQKGRESQNRNIRETSYEELEREIREELKRGIS